MPKIPTFTAKGSVEQLAGTTSNIQVGLNNNLASALAPVTQAIVDFKIKENALQNQAEALRLENDYITDMQGVTKIIQTATDENNKPLYATNKEAANKFLKEQSEFFIQKHKALATNKNVKEKFNNYALAETQKSIFKTDAYVSGQIVASLNNSYIIAKENLIKTAYMDGGIDKETLPADLKKLAIDTYRNQVSPVELQKLINSIPAEIQMYDGLKDVSQFPKKVYQLLKNKDYLPDITFKQREKIKEKAETILRPQITKEFQNYITAKEDGKEAPRFDFELAKQIMTKPNADKMMVAKTMVDDNFDSVKLLHSLPLADLYSQLETMVQFNNEAYSIDIATLSNNYLSKAVENIKSKRKDDAVKYILDTNPDIENQLIELENMTAEFSAPNIYDTSAMTAAQLEFTETIIQKQLELAPSLTPKVMTNQMSQEFVAKYIAAGNKSDIPTMSSMMSSLSENYGDNDGKALTQLLADGLPYGAKVSAIFGDGILAQESLSFETEEEKKKLKNFLKDEGVEFNAIRIEIREGLTEFEDILRRNVPLNSSGTLTEMDNLLDYLTFVASSKMYSNTDLDSSGAAAEAAKTFNDNFVIEDTFYIPRKWDGEDLGDGQINRITEQADLIKNFYLDDFKPVAFKSTTETDAVTLSTKMYTQMSINGEWRNTTDGEGLVFGIVLDSGFAPVLNADGEQLSFKFNDTSELVPRTDILMDFNIEFTKPEANVATSIIDTYEKASELAKAKGITYEEALKEIRKPKISNIKFNK